MKKRIIHLVSVAMFTLLFSGCNFGWGGNDANEDGAEDLIDQVTNETQGVIEQDENWAKIGDFVWKDENRNGIQDAGEPGLPDVQVRIYNEELSGPEMVNDFTPLSTTATNKDGFFSFLVPTGTSYWVYFDKRSLPKGYEAFTNKNSLNEGQVAPGLDSDANYSGLTDPIVVPVGTEQMYDSADAGLVSLDNTGDPNQNDPVPQPSYETCEGLSDELAIQEAIKKANDIDVDYELEVTNLADLGGQLTNIGLKHDADSGRDLMTMGGQQMVVSDGPGAQLFFTPTMVANAQFIHFIGEQPCGNEQCLVWNMNTKKGQPSTAYFRSSDCRFWGVDYIDNGAQAQMRVQYVNVVN